MSILTVDDLVPGARRDDVLDWLAVAANHEALLRAAFPRVEPLGEAAWAADFGPALRKWRFEYRFRSVDREHGGRRVHVDLGGRRTTGKLSFSLRTEKGVRGVRVTVHADYTSGRILGPLLDRAVLAEHLERGMRGMLDELVRTLASDGPGDE